MSQDNGGRINKIAKGTSKIRRLINDSGDSAATRAALVGPKTAA